MSNFVIDEQDIFKYVVLNEEDEENSTRALDCAKALIARLKINIFSGKYYILYSVLEEVTKYNIVLTYDYLNHILSSQKQMLVNNPNIKLFSDDNLTDIVRADRIVDTCLAEFDLLAELDLQDEKYFKANTEFYLKTFCETTAVELATTQVKIINEGVQVGRTFYKGFKDAETYRKKGYQIIKALSEDEDNNLSGTIDTQSQTTDEIKQNMQEEAETEETTKTGISKIDDNYKFRTGEIITIQAGTGVGKTRLANAFVANSLRMRKNVLYLSLEQKANRVFPMQLANLIYTTTGEDIPDLDDKGIIFKTFDPEYQELVDDAVDTLVNDSNYGKLKIDSKNISAVDLKDYLYGVWESGFHFDVFVLDYFGLLETKDKYTELSDVINMLKSEVKSFKGRGFTCIIPNQIDKSSEKEMSSGDLKVEMTKTASSETQYVPRGSDYIFTLEQSNAMKRVGKMNIIVSKVRLGTIYDPIITADCDLGKVLFFDSEESNEYYDDEYAD